MSSRVIFEVSSRMPSLSSFQMLRAEHSVRRLHFSGELHTVLNEERGQFFGVVSAHHVPVIEFDVDFALPGSDNVLEHPRFFQIVSRMIDQDPRPVTALGRDFHDVALFPFFPYERKYTPRERQNQA